MLYILCCGRPRSEGGLGEAPSRGTAETPAAGPTPQAPHLHKLAVSPVRGGGGSIAVPY
jgi:hypothetical protein